MEPRPDKLMPSLYGGLLIATIWAVPGLNFLNCLCCAGVLLGGFLSVLLYVRGLGPNASELTRADCTDLGIYTGVVSAVAGVVIQYLVMAIFGNVMIEMMMRIVERMHLDLPPEYYEMIETAKSADRSVISFVIDIVFMGVVNSLFAFLGALIGWRMFRPQSPA